MGNHKLSQRLLAMVLTVVMVLGLMPIKASADVSTLSNGVVIADFKGLTEELINQTVPFGTTMEELNLPSSLEVEVQKEIEEEAFRSNPLATEEVEENLPSTVDSNQIVVGETSSNSVNSNQLEEQENLSATVDSNQVEENENFSNSVDSNITDVQTTETTIMVPVTWSANPEYNGEQVGTYIFTPTLPADYSLSFGVYAPEIWVTVQEKGPDTTPVTGSIYTVSMSPSTETNISWSELSTKLGDGTIKNGDTLKIINVLPLISDVLIPETISELTIEGVKDMVWPLHIETYAEDMKLTLKDIGLRPANKEALIFNADTELVIEGNVILESNRIVIRSGYDVIISGSGNLDANSTKETWGGYNAFSGASLTVNSAGTLIFNGGASQEERGAAGIVCDNFTLESGTVIANGGSTEAPSAGYTGGHGIDSDIITVRGGSTLKANGGDSTYGSGGDGIYSLLNVTLEAGTVTANGGDAGMGYDHISNNNGLYTAQLTVNGESNLTARGGNATQGVGGIGIICDDILFNGSGNIIAYGGDSLNQSQVPGNAISSLGAVIVNGTGSIQFQKGKGKSVLISPVTLSTITGETWSVDPTSNLISGSLTSEVITVAAVSDVLTTVKLVNENENKPVISIIDKREDITVTEGKINQNISVWATATLQAQLKYQWFNGESRSNSEGVPIQYENSSVLYLPEFLKAGIYYVYCEISAEGADSVKTDAVQITVLPKQNDSPFAGGDGTPETPYQIETAEQLAKLAQLVNSSADSANYSTKYYELVNNIDLSEYAEDGGWLPIGVNGSYVFRGHFEGNGHRITGLTIDKPNGICVGLFGSVYGGTIQNLGLVGVNINGSYRVGGLVGYMDMSGIIQNCYVTGIVSGKTVVGGLVGNSISSTIDNSYTSAAVSGSSTVGGLVGTVSSGILKNSYAIGNVSGEGMTVGGLVGFVIKDATIQNCGAYNSSVSGGNLVGRVSGIIEKGTVTGNFAAAHTVVTINGIPQTIIGGESNLENGVTISAKQLHSKSGFPTTLTESPWSFAEGFYPFLNDTKGNNIDGQVWVAVPSVEIDWDSLKETIENHRGGIGTFTADVNKEDMTVTVTGSIRGANQTLELNIPEGVTVIWKAELGGNISETTDLLHLEGEGAFEIVEGGRLTMSGTNEGNVLTAGESFSEIRINGGYVSVPAGRVIGTLGQETSVTVLNGRVSVTDGTAIATLGSKSIVTVSGGVVDVTRGTTINSSGEVFISGGSVRNTEGTAIISIGNVTVSKSAQITAATGYAIKITGIKSKLFVNGGVVFSYFHMASPIPMGLYILPNLGSPIVEGAGTIVQWDKTYEGKKYTEGTSKHITVAKGEATAKWAIVSNISGIMVVSSTNSFFIPVPEVTVEATVPTVESITIKSAPTKTTYQVGDSLNLSGLVVTLNKSDGSSEDVSFFGFEKKGITTNPLHGGILDIESTVVNITYSENKKSVSQYLTINPQAKEYEVTFDYGGLDVIIRSVEEGTSLGSDLWPTNPVKAGYTFGGWYTGENGTGNVFIPNTIVTGDITVYAKWSPVIVIEPVEKDYTVTFSYGGHTVTKVLVKEGTSLGSDLWPTNPVKAGYTFGGWYTGENGTGNTFTSNTIVDTDVTVYAKWFVVTSSGSDNDGSENTSGNNSNTNSGTTSTSTEQINAQVKQGDTDSVASQIIIERTTKVNGEKSDKVTFQNDKAIEAVQKLKAEGKDTARIVIPDAKDEVAETNVNIPVSSLKTLTAGNISLQIDVEEAKINLPKESVKNASQALKDELYFRLVPVKNQAEKEIVSKEARQNAILVSNKAGTTVAIIGNPVSIETNMPSAKTDIILPLTGIVLPSNKAEKEALLKQLAVYIEHSDGDKELVQGELVEYNEDVYGIRFSITKFSTFTVVKTDAFIKSAAKDITKLTTPSNAVIKGSTITASVANGTSSLTVKAIVSKNATWTLYLDKDLKKEAVNGKLKLKMGANTSYIKVTAEDNTTKVYKLTITRNKSSKAEVTKVIVPAKADIKGSIISATVANEKTSLSLNVKVSSKASLQIYNDKALKKEILNGKLNLKEGLNTVYVKVTAENGSTSKVYTLKITRKAQVYKSHVSLGVIGSKEYANRVAEIFRQDYDSANVEVKRKGNYYLVTMDFKNKTAAKKACEDMVSRKYIVNYYFN